MDSDWFDRVVVISLRVGQPADEGGAAVNRMYRISDRITRLLTEDRACLHVANVVEGSLWENVYYIRDTEWTDELAARVSKLVGDKGGTVVTRMDRRWARFKAIYRSLDDPRPKRGANRKQLRRGNRVRDPYAKPEFVDPQSDPFAVLKPDHPFSLFVPYEPPFKTRAGMGAWVVTHEGIRATPSKERLMAMSPAQRAAFVARCLARVFPYFEKGWSSAPGAIRTRLKRMAAHVESIASGDESKPLGLTAREVFAPYAASAWESDDPSKGRAWESRRRVAGCVAKAICHGVMAVDPSVTLAERMAGERATSSEVARTFERFAVLHITHMLTYIMVMGLRGFFEWDPTGQRLAELLKADFECVERAKGSVKFGKMWPGLAPRLRVRPHKTYLEQCLEEYGVGEETR